MIKEKIIMKKLGRIEKVLRILMVILPETIQKGIIIPKSCL